jgi:hypothetical protein
MVCGFAHGIPLTEDLKAGCEVTMHADEIDVFSKPQCLCSSSSTAFFQKDGTWRKRSGLSSKDAVNSGLILLPLPSRI